MNEQAKEDFQFDSDWLKEYTDEFYSESFWDYIVTFAEEFARANSEA